MSLVSNPLLQILGEIGDELTRQISLAKNTDAKIDARKLSQQAKTLNDVILASQITSENKIMLQKFALTLKDSLTVKSLRYEKQDLERVLANLNDL